MVSSPNLCLLCKSSKNLCGNKPCPLLARFYAKPRIMKRLREDFFGPSTSVFIGHEGYPNVFIGPLAAIESENLQVIDEPGRWFGKSYSELIELRSYILRSKQMQNIKSNSRFIQENQELALAERPTDIEMKFKKMPVYEVKFSSVVQPMGPSAQLEKLRITENVKINRKVEYIVTDELKASHAAFKLYENSQDIYKIMNILSAGILGKQKKLVPTRWGITAVDDLLGKELMQRIKTFPSINDFLVFSSEFLNNHFEILLMPGSWEFENFEAWSPGSTWSKNAKDIQVIEEYESSKGRTRYADKQAGGYYASRFAILESLCNMQKQGRVISFREISEGYTVPLGVWVVRETARNAMQSAPVKFSSLAEALKHIGSKLRVSMEEYKNRSRILQQRRLGDFS